MTVSPASPSALGSTVTASPTSLVAGSSGTTTLTVQARDQYGNAVPTSSSAGTITFDSLPAGSGSIGTVTDNNNGTYTVTYTAGTNAGNIVLTPKLNGVSFSNPLTFAVLPGSVSLATSTVSVSSASLVAGSGTVNITVQLKDSNGNNLISSGGTVTFGNIPAGMGSIGSVTDNGNGTYSATFTAGTTAG
ncbi:MAG: Ig-like domain-containing protein, partial [Planctomycetia bacterium]